jgi:hypothetical protein
MIDLTKDEEDMEKQIVPISNENFTDTNKSAQELKEEKATRENQGNIVKDNKNHKGTPQS